MVVISYILNIFTGLILIALISTVHEYAHALTAYWLGDYTAKADGRLTLNPLKHMDPIGTLLLLITGVGWSKPVPVNQYNLRYKKTGMALVALSGPLANILLLLLISIVIKILILFKYTVITAFILNILIRAVAINLGLALFNLLPIPPLDGYHVFLLFIPKFLKQYWEDLESFSPILIALLLMPFSPFGTQISLAISSIIQWYIYTLIGI